MHPYIIKPAYTLPRYVSVVCKGNPQVTGGIPSQVPTHDNIAYQSNQSAPARLTNIKDGFRLMEPYQIKSHVNNATASLEINIEYVESNVSW